MLRLRSAAIAFIAALALSACRIEDRTPAGSRRDEDAIRSVLATYYQSVGAGDWAASRALFWDSAMVEVRHAGTDSAWREYRTADAYHRDLARRYGSHELSEVSVRIFRLDLRQQGDLASAWVTTRRRPIAGEGRLEVGTADDVILRRAGGTWRIVALASAPDPATTR
ncbi:MAG: nuclear transport factor 2 family protein [Gemmatimonadota bacterium]